MLNNSNMDFIWLCNTAIQFLILKSVKLLLHSIFPDDTIKQGSRMNAEHSHSYLDQPFQSSSQIRVTETHGRYDAGHGSALTIALSLRVRDRRGPGSNDVIKCL